MRWVIISICTSFSLVSNAQTSIPNSSGGPMGQGSWLRFLSGGSSTTSPSIQEFYGLNVIGQTHQPIKINNAALLVGYSSSGENFESGNLFVSNRVGIGTSNANTKLEVNGNIFIGGGNLDGQNLNFLAYSSKVLLGWNRSAGYGEIDMIANQGAGSVGGFRFYNHKNDNSEVFLMSIQGDGNVGIGTTSPQSKLDVNGLMRAKEIKVETANWPDYVFKSNYKLPPLEKLSVYIKNSGHLPDMPSESDVANKGVNLGEIVKLQTKKIEELTLYLIEQNKQLKLHRKQLERQTKRINFLQKQFVR